jgi:hypothetical protein
MSIIKKVGEMMNSMPEHKRAHGRKRERKVRGGRARELGEDEVAVLMSAKYSNWLRLIGPGLSCSNWLLEVNLQSSGMS